MLAQKRRAMGALVFLGLVLGACSNGAPAQDPDVVAGPPPADAGVVQETMNAGGYTYARVDAAGEEVWVAGPLAAELAVGDSVVLAGADNMGQFTSESLGRTFDELYFVGAFKAPGAVSDLFQGTVVETLNAGGYTYAQVEVSEELSWLAPEGSEDLLVWLAGPESELAVGNLVQWQGGAVMRDFQSSSLNRTFAEILFVGAFTVTD